MGFRASLIPVSLLHAVPCALLVALAAGCAQVAPPATNGAGAPAARPVILADFDYELLGTAIFSETNRVRAANGVPRLAPLPALDAAAADQASFMALMFRTQHDNPIRGEHDVAERVRHAGLDGSRVGENVIMMPAQRPDGSPRPDYTYAELAALIVDSWMNSPPHRLNLLDPGFASLGCAARIARGVVRGDLRVFAAQVFYTPVRRPPPRE